MEFLVIPVTLFPLRPGDRVRCRTDSVQGFGLLPARIDRDALAKLRQGQVVKDTELRGFAARMGARGRATSRA
jgi:hypothetical protein